LDAVVDGAANFLKEPALKYALGKFSFWYVDVKHRPSAEIGEIKSS